MMRFLLPTRRWGLAAALVVLPFAVAGVTRPGHGQDTIEGGLWRDQDGNLWCGSTCNRAINQVCCTIRIYEN